jgi:hypothetical protein
MGLTRERFREIQADAKRFAEDLELRFLSGKLRESRAPNCSSAEVTKPEALNVYEGLDGYVTSSLFEQLNEFPE